ncbi:MAG: elongation factor P maturation arginine rhamnosyltransferase EarP [Methylotenera sp.]
MRWDVFCKIVDNFGDVGICWRLSQQLANEHHLPIRLLIDDFATAKKIIPQLDMNEQAQIINGVEISTWPTPDAHLNIAPAKVVIETFACGLPDEYVLQMVRNQSIWINVDHLSAEPWVGDYHAKPSPQPARAITKHYFFPGFKEDTGGLIREQNLRLTRDAFNSSKDLQSAFWQKIGLSEHVDSIEKSIKISMFCYPQAEINGLLTALENLNQPVSLFIPFNSTMAIFNDTFAIINHLNVRVYNLPFLTQSDFDQLLWACDLNFVRGEDSWIRAIWAGKPFIWQPYVQAEDAHITKLNPFLALFYADCSQETKQIIHEAHSAWISSHVSKNLTDNKTSQIWQNYFDHLFTLKILTSRQSEQLMQQPDLASKLVIFLQKLSVKV